MSPTEQLTAWLNSAYGMEHNQLRVLENHGKDSDDLEMRRRFEQHIDETRRHADRMEECLRLLGEKPSVIKGAMGNVLGMVQGVSTGMYQDEVVKNCLLDYSSEHFEIACYRSLAAAAEDAGHPEIARICTEICQEEEAMAEWLLDHIPSVTRSFLHQTSMR